MPSKPNKKENLDKVAHLMGTMPDHEVGALAATNAQAVGRYRRKHSIPAYEGYKFGIRDAAPEVKEAAPQATKKAAPKKATPKKATRGKAVPAKAAPEPTVAEPAAAEPAAEVVEAEAARPGTSRRSRKASRGRPSKITPYRDLVGKIADREIAKRAGVSLEGVRQYRRRHRIALASDARGRPGRKPRAEAVADEATIATSASRPLIRGRRSKLDPYSDLVGTVPDREIAAMAGVTIENVRAWRTRRGIAAQWREDDAPVPEASVPSEVSPPPAARPVAAPGPERSARAEGGLNGFQVRVRVGLDSVEYLIISTDIATAAADAMIRVAGLHSNGIITAVTYMGPALA